MVILKLTSLQQKKRCDGVRQSKLCDSVCQTKFSTHEALSDILPQ